MRQTLLLDQLIETEETVSTIQENAARNTISPKAAAQIQQPMPAVPEQTSPSQGAASHDEPYVRLPAHVDGWTSPIPATPEGSDDEGALWASRTMSSNEVPHKNTFIHYTIDRSPRERPPTPTQSAPGALLKRLFKTRPTVEARPAVDEELGFGFHAHTPARTLSYESLPSTLPEVATIATQTDGIDEAEESKSGSSCGGSPDMSQQTGSTSSTVNFSVDTNSVLVEQHKLGQCAPCNYFWYKVDGCRQGADCTFCHFCPKGEIKKRKKDKIKQLRKAGVLCR